MMHFFANELLQQLRGTTPRGRPVGAEPGTRSTQEREPGGETAAGGGCIAASQSCYPNL